MFVVDYDWSCLQTEKNIFWRQIWLTKVQYYKIIKGDSRIWALFQSLTFCIFWTTHHNLLLRQDVDITYHVTTYIYLPIYYTYTCTEILLRIDRNFCSLHEEITSIRLYTPCNPRSVLRKGCTTWLRLFRMNRTNNFDQSLTRFLYMYMYNI
jgi:hypothetical protein